jgi:hypothetical protein
MSFLDGGSIIQKIFIPTETFISVARFNGELQMGSIMLWEHVYFWTLPVCRPEAHEVRSQHLMPESWA